MTLHRLYVLAVLGAFALPLAGCVYSEQSLSARADAKPDLRLVGTWRAENPKGTPSTDSKPSTCRIAFDEHGIGHLQVIDGGIDQNGSSNFFVTRTAKASYINAPMFDDPLGHTEAKQYLLLKYSLSEDGKTAHLWRFKMPPFQRAFQEGKLKGQFTKGDGHKAEVDTVFLQDSPEVMLSFIDALPDGESFTDEGTFTKVN